MTINEGITYIRDLEIWQAVKKSRMYFLLPEHLVCLGVSKTFKRPKKCKKNDLQAI